jgi:DNA-binding transcriptional LysR family regulator
VELRHLRYFVALGSELHFGRAAARLGITQPPLSRQIQDLEREVGVPLLSRDRHRVGLTDAGRRFLEEALRTLEAADRALSTARTAGDQAVGRLDVGAAHSAQLAVLSRVLPILRERRPRLAVNLRTMDSVRAAAALRTGEIRVALVNLPFEGRDLLVEPVVDEPMVLGLPRRHPLSGKPRVSLRDVAGDTFFVYRREFAPEYHDFTSDLLRRNGGSVERSVEVDSLPAALVQIGAGLGIALLPASSASFRLDGVVFRPIEEDCRSGGIAVTRPREKAPPVVETFLEAVREVFPRKRARA